MLAQLSKNATRRHVHERIRKKVQGTAERPRLNVYRSLNHIYVQLIDDLDGKTLIAASSAVGKRVNAKLAETSLRQKRLVKPLPKRPKPKASPK